MLKSFSVRIFTDPGLAIPGLAGLFYKQVNYLSFHGLSNALWEYLQNTVYTKPLDLGSSNVETMLNNPCVSSITYHVSHVTCRMSCDKFFLQTKNKVYELLGGGCVINGLNPVKFLE